MRFIFTLACTLLLSQVVLGQAGCLAPEPALLQRCPYIAHNIYDDGTSNFVSNKIDALDEVHANLTALDDGDELSSCVVRAKAHACHEAFPECVEDPFLQELPLCGDSCADALACDDLLGTTTVCPTDPTGACSSLTGCASPPEVNDDVVAELCPGVGGYETRWQSAAALLDNLDLIDEVIEDSIGGDGDGCEVLGAYYACSLYFPECSGNDDLPVCEDVCTAVAGCSETSDAFDCDGLPSDDCTDASQLCGNGVVDGDEECDEGVENADDAYCDTECLIANPLSSRPEFWAGLAAGFVGLLLIGSLIYNLQVRKAEKADQLIKAAI